MSTVIGFPHEYRSNGPRRNRKPRAKGGGGGLQLPPGNGKGSGGPASVVTDRPGDGDWLQKLWEFLAAMWAKILELEEKLVLAFERMSTVKSPVAVDIPPKTHITTQEFAALSKDRPEGGLRPETVEKYCREGKLLSVKVNGRGKYGENRIPVEEFVRWQKEGLRRPKPTLPGQFET